jgi:hypothetical protein
MLYHLRGISTEFFCSIKAVTVDDNFRILSPLKSDRKTIFLTGGRNQTRDWSVVYQIVIGDV